MVTHSSLVYVDKNGTIRANVTTFLTAPDLKPSILAGSSFNLSVEDAKDLMADLAKAIYEAETGFDNR